MNAAFYFRAAESFASPEDPDKRRVYERFIDLFYNEVFAQESIERAVVPYGGAILPALRISPATPQRRGTIVIHGDSTP